MDMGEGFVLAVAGSHRPLGLFIVGGALASCEDVNHTMAAGSLSAHSLSREESLAHCRRSQSFA